MGEKEKAYSAARKKNLAGTIGVTMIALFLLFLGITILSGHGLPSRGLCYIICCLMVIWGIWLMGRYIAKEEYRDVANYGFAVGLMGVVLGIAGLIGVDVLVAWMRYCLGILIMILSAVMVQHAVAIVNCRGHAWGCSLVFAVTTFLFALCILLDPWEFSERRPKIHALMYMAVGGLTIWSLCLAYHRSKQYEAEEKRKLEDTLEEVRDLTQPAAGAGKEVTEQMPEAGQSEEEATERPQEAEQSEAELTERLPESLEEPEHTGMTAEEEEE